MSEPLTNEQKLAIEAQTMGGSLVWGPAKESPPCPARSTLSVDGRVIDVLACTEMEGHLGWHEHARDGVILVLWTDNYLTTPTLAQREELNKLGHWYASRYDA